MSTEGPKDDTRWTDAPIQFVPMPTCPSCGAQEDYVGIRVMPTEADGSYSRRLVCRCCSKKWVLVFEPLPESGKPDGHLHTLDT